MARLRTISVQRPPQGLRLASLVPRKSGATASGSADLCGVTQAWPAKVVHFWSGADPVGREIVKSRSTGDMFDVQPENRSQPDYVC